MSKCYLDVIKIGFIVIHQVYCDCVDPEEDPCGCAVQGDGTACLYHDDGLCTCPEAISQEWQEYQRGLEARKMKARLRMAAEGVNHG